MDIFDLYDHFEIVDCNDSTLAASSLCWTSGISRHELRETKTYPQVIPFVSRIVGLVYTLSIWATVTRSKAFTTNHRWHILWIDREK
jgi:hypothetical protein